MGEPSSPDKKNKKKAVEYTKRKISKRFLYILDAAHQHTIAGMNKTALTFRIKKYQRNLLYPTKGTELTFFLKYNYKCYILKYLKKYKQSIFINSTVPKKTGMAKKILADKPAFFPGRY